MIDPAVSIVMRRELARALLALVDQNHSSEQYNYIVDELRPILQKGLEEKTEAGVRTPRKDEAPLTDFAECNSSWGCVDNTDPFFWVQAAKNVPQGEHMYYELQYSIPNGTQITLAQVAPVPDFVTKELTGNWQSQLTCNTNRVLTPVKTLVGSIIQISWIFGLSYDTVIEQCKPFGIFKTI